MTNPIAEMLPYSRETTTIIQQHFLLSTNRMVNVNGQPGNLNLISSSASRGLRPEMYTKRKTLLSRLPWQKSD